MRLPHPPLPTDGRSDRSPGVSANLAEDIFPGNASDIAPIELIKPAIQFGLLSRTKRNRLRVDCKAIPETLEERQSLLWRKVVDVEG
jgi:hypothetical protein